MRITKNGIELNENEKKQLQDELSSLSDIGDILFTYELLTQIYLELKKSLLELRGK